MQIALLTLTVVGLVVNTALCVYLVREVRVVRRQARTSLEVNERILSRVGTRQSQAYMASGPVSEDHQARRIGQRTLAHRVVAGGDPESQLHQQLGRQSSAGVGRKGGQDV